MGWFSDLSFKSVGNFISKNVKSAVSDVKEAAPEILATVGGIAGTLIAPGLGTALGAKLGDWAGGALGNLAGEKIGDLASSQVSSLVNKNVNSLIDQGISSLSSNGSIATYLPYNFPTVGISSQGQQEQQQTQQTQQSANNSSNITTYLIAGALGYLFLKK